MNFRSTPARVQRRGLGTPTRDLALCLRTARPHVLSFVFEEHSMHRRILSASAFLLAASSANAAPLALDLPGISVPLESRSSYVGAMLTVSGPGGIVVQRA